MISSIAGDDDYNNVVVRGQTNFTEHRAPAVQSTQHMQMQNNVTHDIILPSRNHSSRTKVNTTDDSSIKIEESSGCNWCQGNNRIFNPSIRVHGGLTCSDIKQLIDNGKVQHCEAFQRVQNLCCPTANWTHFWGEHNPECFHLTNICHAPNDGKWFYDRSIQHSSADENNKYRRQPTLKYNRTSMHWPVAPDTNIHFNVSSAYRYSGNMSECPYSHTPHHVVSQSAYNHMIGEFYVRQLIGLNQWMNDYPPESDQDIQMYIHLPVKKAQLYDGHRLFMGVLPQNGQVENFQSLVQGKETCECYQTLAFCGYDRNSNGKTRRKNQMRNDTTLGVAAADSVETTKKKNQTRNHIFNVAPGISYKDTQFDKWCFGNDKKKIENCTTYNDIRQDLLRRCAKKDPTLQEKIREYRRQIILSLVSSSEEVKDVDEWKIVGLTERKLRRVWLNIDDSVKACDIFRRQKVVCITVNVEATASPEEQLLMHSSLDALVGIHGAQLTQGTLLPRQGYILELLPWIPDWSWGVWVARTSEPTPVGVMFHNTDLNHLGYSLDRDSVPLCKHVIEEDEKECFQAEQREKKNFMWDRRNFEVKPDVVTKFISSMLLQNSTNCNDMKARASENDFVLYNAYCSRGVENVFSTEHFYVSQ